MLVRMVQRESVAKMVLQAHQGFRGLLDRQARVGKMAKKVFRESLVSQESPGGLDYLEQKASLESQERMVQRVRQGLMAQQARQG